jgi:dimethylhistidine N-methyltransferase
VRAYVPVDIDADTLRMAAARLRRQFRGLEVVPVAADFTQPWELPPMPADSHTVVFYPGSTIGNLDPADAEVFLTGLGRWLKREDGLLIGYDLEKDRAVLERAYDDPSGVTAAFNKNMLVHLNTLVGADFEPRRFEHVAFWNAERHRIEMHLRSVGDQVVHVDGRAFRFEDGDTIHTESSYKYTRERFNALARRAGFAEHTFWTDAKGWFAVALLRWRG